MAIDLGPVAQIAAESELNEDYALWLLVLFDDYCSHPLADHHVEFWEWVWSIQAGVKPAPFCGIWPRGGAKSTSAEMACVAFAARRVRRYGLYISMTQEQADDHVGNVAAMLESARVEAFYPALAERLVGKYGNSRGWRRNRLRTASGFTLDALGLDTAARGIKIEDARPDLAVIDDIDSESDTAEATEKKVRTLTRKILPAGSADLAVLAIQNLVHPEGVFARLAGKAEKKADFLTDRIVSGPIPALRGFSYAERDGRWVITAGEPSWRGQDIQACQDIIDTVGISAFLSECQHDVEAPPGGMYDHLAFPRCTEAQLPELVRTVVWVDPAVTDKDTSDSQAIQADALGVDGRIYRLRSYEHRGTPQDTLKKALRWAIELKAEKVGVETDQGGDTWYSVWREALAAVEHEMELQRLREPVVMPRFDWRKAGSGHGSKTHRSAQMLADYERPGQRIVHVEGTHLVLERALRRFPKTKPLDLCDAAYWGWHDLRGGGGGGTSHYTDNRDRGRR